MRKKSYTLFFFVFMVLLAGFAYIHQVPREPRWKLADVTGHLPDLQFSLRSDEGPVVTAQDLDGNIILLYFGFTRCPDECPVTMARMSVLLRSMGKDADHIRLLFVSVDPAHDTPQVMHEYIQSFDPAHMVGLNGDDAAIGALAKRYHAVYQTGTPAHSDAIYIFDSHGKARLIATSSDTDSHITDDLKRLVAGF